MALFGGRDTNTQADDTNPETYLVPKDDKKLIVWLERKKQLGRKRLPDFQMKLNLAYVMGQQFVTWDTQRRTLRNPQNRPDDPNPPVRIKVNKVGGITERFIARLTKSAPEPETRPTSDDDKNIGAAKAGTRILQSELNRVDWESLLVRHYFWVVTHGWAYVKLMWDPTAGNKVGSVTPDGSKASQDVMMGEVLVEVVPAFELAVDPDATSMDNARWAVHTRSMSREAVWEKYGKVPAGADTMRSIADEVYQLVNSINGGKGDDKTDNVGVHQLWMVPCKAAPEGLVITWSGKTILEAAKPFPYAHGKLPFVQFDLLPGLGRREGRTWMDDLVPIQADYNDARSREATLRRTLIPKVFSPAGAIDNRRLSSRLEIVDYNPAFEKPTFAIPDSGWMSQFEVGMQRADNEMGDRAGQSDVSSGQTGSASMPAAAILALQEADDTKLAISYKLMSDAISNMAWQWLELIRQFWSEERTVRTWSEEGALEVKQFRGSDVADQLEVQVKTDTGVVRSKSAMVQLSLDLWDRKVLTDPRQLLRLIKVPGTDFLAEAWNIDTRQAQRENEYLLTGVKIEIHTFDNHQVHISEHDNMRKTEEYDKLLRQSRLGDPEATAILASIDAHVMAHYGAVLPQMSVPTGSTPMSDHPVAQAAGAAGALGMASPDGSMGPGSAGPGEYLNPLTGLPTDSTMVGAGAAPSSLEGSAVAQRAGIGGAGQPGQVPGASPDQQAASMGA